MKINYTYSQYRKFRDITNQREDVVKATANSLEGVSVNVFECRDTYIIYSQTNERQHASLSNGCRPVKEWEIGYAITKILKVKPSDTNIFVTENNVVHIHHKKDYALLN